MKMYDKMATMAIKKIVNFVWKLATPGHKLEGHSGSRSVSKVVGRKKFYTISANEYRK